MPQGRVGTQSVRSQGTRPRRLRLAPLLAVALIVALAPVSAQVLPDCDIDEDGFWSGYWDLGSQINDQPVGLPDKWTEITHAAVLPPPNDRYLLLWCERNAADCIYGQWGQYETWMFNWTNPNRPLKEIVVPQSPNEVGVTDLFCGASVYGAHGQLVCPGGTDYVQQCALPATSRVGHDRVWTFDNASTTWPSTPAWRAGGSLATMANKRWYPSFVELGNGDMLVLGDFEGTGAEQASYSRQRGRTLDTSAWTFGWDTGPTTNHFFNWGKGIVPPNYCDEIPGVYAYQRGYPWVHLVPGPYMFTYPGYRWTQSLGVAFVGTLMLDFNLCAGDPATAEV